MLSHSIYRGSARPVFLPGIFSLPRSLSLPVTLPASAQQQHELPDFPSTHPFQLHSARGTRQELLGLHPFQLYIGRSFHSPCGFLPAPCIIIVSTTLGASSRPPVPPSRLPPAPPYHLPPFSPIAPTWHSDRR